MRAHIFRIDAHAVIGFIAHFGVALARALMKLPMPPNHNSLTWAFTSALINSDGVTCSVRNAGERRDFR